MSDEPTRVRRVRRDPGDPVILPAEETQVREVRATPPAPGSEPEADVVHEEERTRVLPDGTVVRDGVRVEQRSRTRERLPWVLIALLLAILTAGVASGTSRARPARPCRASWGCASTAPSRGSRTTASRPRSPASRTPRPAGIVFGQNPAAATEADSGSTVRLLVSSGPSSATVLERRRPPAERGSQQARQRPASRSRRRRCSRISRPATVVAQDPAAGERVAPGAKVRLNVSKGSGDVDVPERGRQHGRPGAVRPDRPGLHGVGRARRVRSAARHRRGAEPGERQGPEGLVRASDVSQGPADATTTGATATTTATVPSTDGRHDDHGVPSASHSPRAMRTCVRVARGHDPPRRRGLLLRRRSSSVTIRASVAGR